jgi:hypothetical protein
MARRNLSRFLGPKQPILGRLHICTGCGGAFVLLTGELIEEELGRWRLGLRCGACGHRTEALVGPGDARGFQRTLEQQVEQIAAAADRLADEAMTSWVETFSVALERDLIDACDFR